MEETSKFKVLIVGGGLGGLCLAQGLKKAGIDFRVFERDASPVSRLQGYRLSINPAGIQSLHANLPDALWGRIEAVLMPQVEGISFVSEQLDQLFFKKTPDPIDALNRFGSISRVKLRDILLSGLEDNVDFGRKFLHYKLLDDGKVRCIFDDGSSADGHILVGADGTKSLVRSQLLPGSSRAETGVSAIAGQVIMDEITCENFLPVPLRESAVVIDKKPQGLFLANHKLNEHQGGENYVFWSFLTNRSNFPDNLETMSAEAIIQLVDNMTSGWHPRLKRLITRADAKTVLVLSYKTSKPPARWQTGTVTVMGDAIHSMPPTSGEGANIALQDAAVLCASLVDYEEGKTTLHEAVDKYETVMLDYAFKAVGNAMVNLHRMVVRDGKYTPKKPITNAS